MEEVFELELDLVTILRERIGSVKGWKVGQEDMAQIDLCYRILNVSQVKEVKGEMLERTTGAKHPSLYSRKQNGDPLSTLMPRAGKGTICISFC